MTLACMHTLTDSKVSTTAVTLKATVFFHHKCLAIKPVLSSSELDEYLYIDIEKSELNRLQLLQNAAVGLLTGTKKCWDITPVISFVFKSLIMGWPRNIYLSLLRCIRPPELSDQQIRWSWMFLDPF